MKYDFTALTNIAPATGKDLLVGLHGYKPEHPLARAHEGTVDCENMDDVPEYVFVMLNRDDRPNAHRAPSLSVGDVVVVHTPDGDIAYACESLGFSRLDTTPDYENVDDYLDSVEAFRNA